MAPPRLTSHPLEFVTEDDNWRFHCNLLPVYWALIPFPTEDVATEDVASLIGSKVAKSNFEWLNWHWKQGTLQPSQWRWLFRETSQSTHPTDCTQWWRRSPLTARAALACPLPKSLQLWTKRACCLCRSPADRESGDTKQTVFIGVVKLFLNAKPISHEKKGELLMMDCFVSYFKDYFICRNLDQESDDSADFWYLNLQATGW